MRSNIKSKQVRIASSCISLFMAYAGQWLNFCRKKIAALRWLALFCAMFGFVLSFSAAHAADDETILATNPEPIQVQETILATNPEPSTTDPVQETLSHLHSEASSKWIGLVERIDKILAGSAYQGDDAKSNKSYIRITVDTDFRKGSEVNSDIRVKARIDLPNTKKRLRLLFDSEDAAGESLEKVTLNKQNADDNALTAALQWMLRQNKKWKDSISIGVRDFPHDPIVRLRSDFNTQLNEDWSVLSENSVFYSKEDKLFAKAAFRVQRRLNAASVVANTSALYWKDEENTVESTNVTSYERVLDADRSYSHAVGFIATNKPSAKTSNYFLRTVYSQRLYKDHVFVELTPLIEFPRAGNFSAEPSLNARLIIYLR